MQPGEVQAFKSNVCFVVKSSRRVTHCIVALLRPAVRPVSAALHLQTLADWQHLSNVVCRRDLLVKALRHQTRPSSTEALRASARSFFLGSSTAPACRLCGFRATQGGKFVQNVGVPSGFFLSFFTDSRLMGSVCALLQAGKTMA